jgi:hypothetical protein
VAIDLRTDDSHNITYPTTPDTRGTARIYHQRKPYYFGQHDSPLSYVVFGLWKNHLMTHGEAPAIASFRDQAETFLGVVPSPKKRILKAIVMASTLTLASAIGALVGASFNSTQAVNQADGKALSAYETEFIRGVRNANENLTAHTAEESAPKVAQEALALSKGLVDRDEILSRIRK